MEKTILNQNEAIKRLKANEDLSQFQVKFDDTAIEALDAILLGKNNFIVPEDLIYYDDEDIDYSDDPGLTEGDLESGKIAWVINAELTLDEKVRDWVRAEKINLNELSSRLVTEFYRQNWE